MTGLILKDTTTGEECPVPEIDLSAEPEIDCIDRGNGIRNSFHETSGKISFLAINIPYLLSLLGVNNTNNYRKMHGGVMTRRKNHLKIKRPLTKGANHYAIPRIPKDRN